MPLRLKILALAGILLVAFAITTALSAYQIRGVMHELGSIVDYHIALSALVAEIDVITDEYELNVRRLLEKAGEAQRTGEPARRQAEIAARLPAIFEHSRALLARGAADPRNDASDRVRLAHIDGTLRHIGQQVASFLALGRSVEAALERGRIEDARRLADGFRAYEAPFGPDIAEIRRTIAELTNDSTRETERRHRTMLWLNGVLFVLAAAVSLGFVAFLATRLTRAFHRLLEGTRKVEAGELAVQVPVTSRDEIGHLTEAFNRMITELRTKERIKDTFGKFLDPRLVTQVLGAQADHGDAAERRVVTIFFSDIKAFSAVSEQLTADVMVRLLNAYFTTITRIIRAQNGIVDKFMGDAVMAFWAPPFSAPDRHAADACLAALAQQAALADFRRELSTLTGLRRNVPDFRVRMGLATGEVVVGTIGSDAVKTYTVIGDTVNLASRLESANKVYGTGILVTEDTFRLARDVVEARELDLLVVAGKTEPVRVYEVLAPVGRLEPPAAELRAVFAEGLAAYRTAKWETADRKFRECLQLAPDDGPSRTFLDRVAALRTRAPFDDWTGVWTLDHK
jgi:adenylate cyclase